LNLLVSSVDRQSLHATAGSRTRCRTTPPPPRSEGGFL